MAQMSRNLTDASDGFLTGKRFQSTTGIRCSLSRSATRSPPRRSGGSLASPVPESQRVRGALRTNIKESCLDRMILVGEESLRCTVREFSEHYHRERNHQGLGNQSIVPVAPQTNHGGRVVSRERLGGLLKYYRLAALQPYTSHGVDFGCIRPCIAARAP
jgi:hypothetical protein